MFQSHANKVVVQVKTKWVKNMSNIARVAAIQNLTSLEPQDYVNNIGTVVSAPKSITDDRRDYWGFSAADIRPGDTVIMHTGVIFEFESTAPQDDPIYKNLITYRGEEYWLADIRHIYATIRDGKIRMQNGYVMVEEMEKPAQIYLPQHVKKSISTASAKVSFIGKPRTHMDRIDVEHGDTVYFNPNILRVYQVDMKPFGILQQHQIVGKRIPGYEEIAAMN